MSPDGSAVEYTYDAKQNIIRVKDPDGNVTHYVYDKDGIYLEKIAVPKDGVSNYTSNNAQGFVITSYAYTIPADNTNVKGLIKTLTLPGGDALNYEAFEYYVNGSVSQHTVYDGGTPHTTSYTYNRQRHIETVTSPQGYLRQFAYDANGRTLRESYGDPSGGLPESVTRTVYDVMGRVVQVVSPSQYDPSLDDLFALSYGDPNAGTRNVYESSGVLLSTTNAQGETTSYTYDIYGRVVTVTNPGGLVSKTEYDEIGRALNGYASTNGGSTFELMTEYTYELLPDMMSSVAVTSYTDPGVSSTTTTIYDAMERVVKTTFEDGTQTTASYTPGGLVASTTDQAGNATAYTYDKLGRLTQVKRPFAGTQMATTLHEYDDRGRLVKTMTPSSLPGQALTYSINETIYNNRDLVVAEISYGSDAPGNKTYIQYEYDGESRPVRRYTGQSGLLSLAELDEESGGDYAVHRTEYNHLGSTRAYDPLGNYEEYVYDAAGRVASKTDRNGAVTSYTYDLLDRMIRKTITGDIAYPDMELLQLGLRPAEDIAQEEQETRGEPEDDREASEIPDEGNAQELSYEEGEPREEEDLPGEENLPGEGDPLAEESAEENPEITLVALERTLVGETMTFTYTYDNAGMLIRLSDGESTNHYSYDRFGRMVGEEDSSGTSRTYAYNLGGQLIETTLWVDNDYQKTVSYTYDSMGRLSKTLENGVVVSTHAYTALGRLSEATYDNGVTAQYSYDEGGNITALTNTGASGAISWYQYSYYLNGNMRAEQSHLGTKTYEYDGIGQLVRATETTDGKTVERGYAFDRFMNRARMVVESDNETSTTEYTYDEANRLISQTTVVEGGEGETGEDETGEGEGEDKTGEDETGENKTGETTTVYTYDANGSMLSKVTAVRADYYTYDLLDRLLRVDTLAIGKIKEELKEELEGKVGEEQEFDDPDGPGEAPENPDEQEPGEEEPGELEPDAEGFDPLEVSLYAPAGNVGLPVPDLSAYEGGEESPGGEEGFVESEEVEGIEEPEEEAQSEEPDKGAEATEEPEEELDDGVQIVHTAALYAYYAKGLLYATMRMTMDSAGLELDNEKTILVYAGNKVELELDGDGEVKASYTYSSRLIKSETAYYVFNGYRDVVQLTDFDGIVIRDYDYDPYGVQLTNGEDDMNPFRYKSEYHDAGTGLIYLKNRFYDPSIGRFISLDPIRDGLNWYVYAGNNPIMYYDPTGLSQTYTVQSGDTLWGLAQRYLGDGSRYNEIAALNNISNPNLIITGQTLRIPQGSGGGSDDISARTTLENTATTFATETRQSTLDVTRTLGPGGLFNSIDEAAKDAAIFIGVMSFENSWEYATSIYKVQTLIGKAYVLDRSLSKIILLKVYLNQYSYDTVQTDKDPVSVRVPDAPSAKERVAAVHTHPYVEGYGIDQFSQADKDWSDIAKVPIYVYGSNGYLRRYDAATGEDVTIFTDLPKDPKYPGR